MLGVASPYNANVKLKSITRQYSKDDLFLYSNSLKQTVKIGNDLKELSSAFNKLSFFSNDKSLKNKNDIKDDVYLSSKKLSNTVEIKPFLNVLTLGEADYSFSRAYMTAYPHCFMFASRYETTSFPNSCYKKIKENFEFLSNKRAMVCKGIDALKISNNESITSFIVQHPLDGKKGFDRIFFNFPYPLPDGQYIQGRAAKEIPNLLKNFMPEARKLLSPRGQIIIGGYNDFYRKNNYYNPNALAQLGFSFQEYPWDEHGVLNRYGYAHRDSNRDISTNSNATSTNASKYTFSINN